MTSVTALPVERLHDVVAVLGVDAQQLAHHEADRAPLVGGLRLHLLPQLLVNVAQPVLGHGPVILSRNTLVDGRLITTRAPLGDLDHRQVITA